MTHDRAPLDWLDSSSPESGELSSLLAAERARPEDGRLEARLRQRVATSLGISLGPGLAVPPDPATAAPDLAGAGGAGEVLASAASPVITAAWWKTTVVLALGVGLGASGHAVLTGSRDAPVESLEPRAPIIVLAPASDKVAGPAVSATATPATPETVIEVKPDAAQTPAARTAPAPAAADAALAAEKNLLRQAAAALARNQPAEALAALDEHARLFPRGQLAPERELLRERARPLGDSTPSE